MIGVGATGVPPLTVLFTGIAGLVAGALSMGAGEYVSVRSHRELLDASCPDLESQSALTHLRSSTSTNSRSCTGPAMSEAEAEERARGVLANHRLDSDDPDAVGVDPADAIGSAWGAAISSFLSFAVGALIPVLPYLLGATGLPAVIIAAVAVGIALVGTGAVVGILSGASPFKRALRQLLIGYGAAAVTYLLGLAFGATLS
ncbi:MAG: VIT1/CCC1 transporter family protein [Schumannella sp.]